MTTPLQSKRGQGRLSAMRFLYEHEMNPAEDLQEAMRAHFNYMRVKEGIAGYARVLIEGTLKHQKQIDKILEENLSNWSLDRVSSIDRTVLRIGVYELVYAGDVPYTVTINEMVEVSKQFGNADSAGFANGVLDGIRKKLEKQNGE